MLTPSKVSAKGQKAWTASGIALQNFISEADMVGARDYRAIALILVLHVHSCPVPNLMFDPQLVCHVQMGTLGAGNQ